MSYYKIPLLAAQEYRLEAPGTLLLVDSVGVAEGVDIALIRNGSDGVTMPLRKSAFRHIGRFDGVVLTAQVNTTVGIFLSFDDVQLGMADNSAVKIPDGVKVTNTNAEAVPVKNAPGAPIEVTNPIGERLNVDIGGGVITVTADNVGINNTEANPVPTKEVMPAGITAASVAATDVIAALLVVDATRRGFYARNAGPDPVALVQAAGTFADAAVVLQPGETWKEDIAPGAAWYCICDAGKTATVKVLGAA